ncbi:cobalt-precorrin-6A reductase [Acidocella facilis]|uniref:cobalt-precorrin-6A reductase n=1 Tax=Acidocella facilis TaxID=525 RepID=UPI000478AAEC|nr:cobalt-precorrin-6A reductase [Acidocella facilis]
MHGPTILLLGGTSEASQMARALAESGLRAVFSYAGRTEAPKPQPLPTRIGGFGGAAGLADYLRAQAITHLIDATHPFAAQMSRNAIAACAAAGVKLIALERPAWQAEHSDDWQSLATLEEAAAALPERPARVFLAIGKQNLDLFAARQDHFYLLRLVDAPVAPLPFRDAAHVIDRGPFSLENDLALLRAHRITHLVAKNAGGIGASAKLGAARALGVKILMVERPALPARRIVQSPEAVLAWLAHGAERGV